MGKKLGRRKNQENLWRRNKIRRNNILSEYGVALYFIVAIIWLELTFHLIMFQRLDGKFLYPVLFSIPMGTFLGLLCSLTRSRKANYIIACVLTLFCSILFGANMVYHSVFDTYVAAFSMIAQGTAAQALTFGPFLKQAIAHIGMNIWGIVLLLIPFLFLLTVGRNLLSFRQGRGPVYGVMVAVVVLFHGFGLILVNAGTHEDGSIYDLYYHSSSLDEEVEQLGVSTSMRLDLKNVIFGKKNTGLGDLVLNEGSDWQNSNREGSEAVDAEESGSESETVVETEPETEPDLHDLYNFTDIDFDQLIEEAEAEGNSDLVTMHQYYASQSPTNKNEYTGIYEGYNVIFITAEGFSPYAVYEDLTPTLYKLVNTGYVFNNFYTPLWYGSTLSGEYANLVSQIPLQGDRISMEVTGENKTDMYFCLGRMLERAGYNLWAFHNNTATYYNRQESHPNMGYTNWIAIGTGYEPETNASGNVLWPQSDLNLIDTTFDLYATSEPFHAYYMTVSGHAEYNFTGNSMSARNREAVEDLPLSDTAKAYIACNMELDKAVESLLNKLEEAGIADHTLVVLSADHIPYADNYKDMMDELAAYQKGVSEYHIEQSFERYRNNLIIWTGSMEEGENIVVDKPCYSMDILPTIANMLGLDYESRVLVGRDIFSDEEGLVIFPNASWLTEKATYDNKTGEVTSLVEEELPENYGSDMTREVRNRIKVSRMFVDMNYYSYLHE
jgi:hypothetical protein